MTKSSFEKRNSKNNILINNSTNNAEIIHNILEIKPIKRKSFVMKTKIDTGKKKKTLSKKLNNNNNFIQVNTKRKNEIQKSDNYYKIAIKEKL